MNEVIDLQKDFINNRRHPQNQEIKKFSLNAGSSLMDEKEPHLIKSE
jgi:hypothetical protein